MKQSVLNFILLLFSWGICSCDKDCDFEKRGDSDGNNIRFSIELAPSTRVNTDVLFNCNWEEGDEIGIFAVRSGETLQASGNYIHNAKLSYDGEQWVGEQGVALTWPEEAGGLLFYAYYPYDFHGGFPEQVDPTRILKQVSMLQDNRTAGRSDYNYSDLLTAKSSVETGDLVDLYFSHQLSLIQLTVIPGNNTPETMEQLEVKLENVQIKYVLNFNGKYGPETNLETVDNESVQLTLHRSGKDRDGNWIYRGLVPPQTLEIATSTFTFELQGKIVSETTLLEFIRLYAGTAELFQYELPDIK